MKLIVKINEARKKIKLSNLKKAGRNQHSNYDYYTPEQVNQLVNDACAELNLFNSYELIRTELGLVAQLTVFDLEDSTKFKVFSMATEIPSITATNIAQQLGGAVTYSERYLLMTIYDIKDNNLDFDSHQPKEPKTTSKTDQQSNFETRALTKKEVDEKWNGKIYKDSQVFINNVKILPPKEQIEKLKLHTKYKPDDKH
jgi:hypothetical protein